MSIYEALQRDHDKVIELLEQLIDLPDEDPRRSYLVGRIRDELVPHARAEEAVLYNSLRLFEDGREVIGHAYVEHMQAEAKLRMLQGKEKMDLNWRETAKDLREALIHHIRHEEDEVFSTARFIFTPEEAEMMGTAFEQLKPEIRDEGMVQTTLELITNLMPKRLVPALRSINLEARI
jgi:hemerythrin superfamily protein